MQARGILLLALGLQLPDTSLEPCGWLSHQGVDLLLFVRGWLQLRQFLRSSLNPFLRKRSNSWPAIKTIMAVVGTTTSSGSPRRWVAISLHSRLLCSGSASSGGRTELPATHTAVCGGNRCQAAGSIPSCPLDLPAPYRTPPASVVACTLLRLFRWFALVGTIVCRLALLDTTTLPVSLRFTRIRSYSYGTVPYSRSVNIGVGRACIRVSLRHNGLSPKLLCRLRPELGTWVRCTSISIINCM